MIFKFSAALVASFILIFTSIPLGAMFSVLGNEWTDKTLEKIHTEVGFLLPAIIFSTIIFFIFTHTKIKLTWVSLVVILPIVGFWLFTGLNAAQASYSSWMQSLIWVIAAVCIAKKNQSDINR
jgi:ABC-type dipeptide/oligopeptide/nickel transport system permease component